MKDKLGQVTKAKVDKNCCDSPSFIRTCDLSFQNFGMAK